MAADLRQELGSGARVAAHPETGLVRFIGAAADAAIDNPGASSLSPARAALAFVGDHASALGVANERTALAVTDVAPTEQGSVVRVQQEIDGVPVMAGEFAVNLDASGDVLSLLGEATKPAGVASDPRITGDATTVIAGDYLRKAYPKASGLEFTAPELQIWDSRLMGGDGLDLPTLAWTISASGENGDEPLGELVVIDAQQGNVIETIPEIYHAKERQICDANSGNTDVCEAPFTRSEGGAATGIAEVDNAYDLHGGIYDLYFNRFGRDSIDGLGMPLKATVRYCPDNEFGNCPWDNAYWSRANRQMVYGQGWVIDDVVGHELTHGVTNLTSGLYYYYQSGAINESISDVFGELFDLTTGSDQAASRWLLAEGSPGGAIRYMKDPSIVEFLDPDSMSSFLYFVPEDDADAGGVHINSGVNNKAAYLMTDGDTFQGRTVTGLGIDKVLRLYYDVNTKFLTSGSEYKDLFNALNQACTNLIGTEGFTSGNCTEVNDATLAVEMNEEPEVHPNPDAPTCDSGLGANTLFFDDMENTSSGNWASNAQSGENEWFYPTPAYARYASSGKEALWGNDGEPESLSFMRMTQSISIPASVPNGAYMRFMGVHGFEDVGEQAHSDGGVVEYSTNNGSTWQDAGSLFTHNGYQGELNWGFLNPLGAGRDAFVAESNGWMASRINLTSLAGQSVRFRFGVGNDIDGQDYGWWIDDVHIYTCGTPQAPPAPTVSSTNPVSGSNENNPKVLGSAQAGSTVRLYKNVACTGTPAATGTASQFAHPGITLNVADNSTTQIRASATNATGTSPCSSALPYIEDSNPPPQPPNPPVLSSTSPASGANNNNPLVIGSADSNTTISIYKHASCGNAVAATGTAAELASPGIGITVNDNTTTPISAKATNGAGTSSCSNSISYQEVSGAVPAAPTLSSTNPVSGSNNNLPKIIGSAPGGTTVNLYKNPTAESPCTGPPAASGTAAQLASPGIEIDVSDNSTTVVRASATNANGTSTCSSPITYVENSQPAGNPPPIPSITSTDPASGTNNNNPKVIGTAESGSTVSLYRNVACTGSPAATGTAAQFSSPGITLSVNDNTTTNIRATATNAAGTSGCSTIYPYVEDSLPGAQPPATPTLTSTNPASGSNENNPEVIGVAEAGTVGSSRVDLQACKLEYSIVSPK